MMWVLVGVLTTMLAYNVMGDEIDMALGMETEEELMPFMRFMLPILLVLFWPMTLIDLIGRR